MAAASLSKAASTFHQYSSVILQIGEYKRMTISTILCAGESVVAGTLQSCLNQSIRSLSVTGIGSGSGWISSCVAGEVLPSGGARAIAFAVASVNRALPPASRG